MRRITFVRKNKKCRPPYRFLPVGLNMWHAVERGSNLSILQPLTRKRQAGDKKSTFSLVLSFFALEKRKYI